jgi:hypothetical protein
MTAYGLVHGPEGLARKFPVDDSHQGRLVLIVQLPPFVTCEAQTCLPKPGIRKRKSRGSITFMPSFAHATALAAAIILLPRALYSVDADTKFHNAPVSAQALKNPYAGQEEAAQAGKQLYASHCLS